MRSGGGRPELGADGFERGIGIAAERGDCGHSHGHDERQHHGVFDCGGTVLTA